MHTHWAANKNTADSANASRKHRAPRSDAASTPAIGRAQTPPQRGHARHSLRNRENSDIKRAQISDVERARILDPGPALMRWDACRGWQAFPRASDACDRDGSLLLLKSIARPKGTRQVESVSAGDVGRYAPPQRNRQMRRARSRSSLARGKTVLRVDWFSGSIGSRGRFRDRLTSHSGFAQKWLRLEKRFAQERPTGKSCPQMELCAPVEDPTHINLESLEEKGPPQWPKR